MRNRGCGAGRRRAGIAIRLAGAVAAAATLAAADFPRQWFFNAHNCYPHQGRGADRLERARALGLKAVELDLAWSPARGRAVISHETKLQGGEPTLEEYFFGPLDAELRAIPRGTPAWLLLLDFKSDHAGPVEEVLRLLSQRRALVTTAADQLDWGPLTVILTGNNRAIAQFEKLSAAGGPYLAMGNREPPERKFREEVAGYIPEPATAFYRVFNFEWKHVEREPNDRAGAWRPAERARLGELVRAAHRKGYWLRAWTLNATATDWGTSQRFGARQALLERWRAAEQAGVEMIATDEYELAAGFRLAGGATPPTDRSRRSQGPGR